MSDFESIDELAAFLGISKEELQGGLDLPSAASLLGIGTSTLRQRALNGRIAYSRDGRRWLFSWRDIAKYIQRRHRPVNPETGSSTNKPSRKPREHKSTTDAPREMGLL